MSTLKEDFSREDGALSGENYRLLAGIALMAVELGSHALAQRMASNLKTLRPDLPYCSGLIAMSQLASGNARDALRTLEDCLEEFPGFAVGQALHALCVAETGGTGWQAKLESLIEEGSDEFAVELACGLLGRANPYRHSEREDDSDQSENFNPSLSANNLWV